MNIGRGCVDTLIPARSGKGLETCDETFKNHKNMNSSNSRKYGRWLPWLAGTFALAGESGTEFDPPSCFLNHAIVVIASKVYDSFYGRVFESLQDWSDTCFAGIKDSNRNYYNLKFSNVLEVKLIDVLQTQH